MFRLTVFSFACCLVAAVGCTPENAGSAGPTSAPASGSGSTMEPEFPPEGAGSSAKDDQSTPPAPSDGSSVELSSENTKIVFVGAHTDKEKPDPRTGNFNEFTGKITFDKEQLTGIEVEISTDSLSTEIDKLTTHLLGPDFFNVREFPLATFKTTEVAVQDGKTMVAGELTLLGETKAVSFPAEVSMEGGSLKLDASFEIDRSQFGMNYGLEKIEKTVLMTISVEA